MIILQSYSKAELSNQNQTGCGESLKHANHIFSYRIGKNIPKDRIVSLLWEGNFCGRFTGDKEWIIVAWNGEGFVLLEHVYQNITQKLKNYKNFTNEQAVNLLIKEEAVQKFLNEYPKCTKCESIVFKLEDDQPVNICFMCYKKQ